jgi:hydrogenase nickel incorporation protein HypA/HybF
MHEVSIMAEAVRMAVEAARAAGASRITKLQLRVGALSGVVPDALQFAFEAVTVGTLAEQATLTIEHIPARFWCQACEQEYEAAKMFAECPQCHNFSSELRSGRQMELASMEIE